MLTGATLRDGRGSAVLSDDRLYRYELRRKVSEYGRPNEVLWVMCNPSTADENEDDPTIRKCMGFTKRWGYERMLVVNAFALRSPDPGELLKATDPYGPGNTEALARAFREHGDAPAVLAWGDALPKPLRSVALARAMGCAYGAGVEPVCLGITRHGQPRHPLMLGYSTSLVPFLVPAC